MISTHAMVSSKAALGKNIQVGPYTIIHDNVIVGNNCIIGSHCEIGVANSLSNGKLLYIGNNSHIRSHSVFYEGSKFGDELVTGHQVTVRERTQAGKGLQVGTNSDIQGHCQIGDYVKLHSNVFIAHETIIQDFVWLFPFVVITSDPHPPSETLVGAQVKSFAAIAANSVILPGAILHEGCLVAANSTVKGELLSNHLYAGSPATNKGSLSRIKIQGTDFDAYPWRRHFHRGYPEGVVNKWIKEFDSHE